MKVRSLSVAGINIYNYRKRKRQRRAEVINALAADSPAHKRRSSISELGLLSMSGSFLDSSDRNLMLSPEPTSSAIAATAASSSVAVERGAMMERPAFGGESDISLPVPCMSMVKKEVTPRQQVFHELVTTESNYVAILDCVYKIAQVQLYKDYIYLLFLANIENITLLPTL